MSGSKKPAVSTGDLLEPAIAGKISAIARLLTRAENAEEKDFETLSKLYRHTGKAHFVVIPSGVPGTVVNYRVVET